MPDFTTEIDIDPYEYVDDDYDPDSDVEILAAYER